MSYTAVLLDSESRSKLKAQFADKIPDGWEVIAHHMTTNMGAAAVGPASRYLNVPVTLTVQSLASNDRVMAVGVECEVPSTNAKKHITLAVNRAGGGSPRMSNQLQEWVPVTPLLLRGVVMEVSS